MTDDEKQKTKFTLLAFLFMFSTHSLNHAKPSPWVIVEHGWSLFGQFMQNEHGMTRATVKKSHARPSNGFHAELVGDDPRRDTMRMFLSLFFFLHIFIVQLDGRDMGI